MNEVVYEMLKEVAKHKDGRITYGEVAKAIDLNMANPLDRDKISGILGEISAYTYRLCGVMLSVVVVLADRNQSITHGKGFFALARTLKADEYAAAGDDEILVKEYDLVHDPEKRARL